MKYLNAKKFSISGFFQDYSWINHFVKSLLLLLIFISSYNAIKIAPLTLIHTTKNTLQDQLATKYQVWIEVGLFMISVLLLGNKKSRVHEPKDCVICYSYQWVSLGNPDLWHHCFVNSISSRGNVLWLVLSVGYLRFADPFTDLWIFSLSYNWQLYRALHPELLKCYISILLLEVLS